MEYTSIRFEEELHDRHTEVSFRHCNEERVEILSHVLRKGRKAKVLGVVVLKKEDVEALRAFLAK